MTTKTIAVLMMLQSIFLSDACAEAIMISGKLESSIPKVNFTTATENVAFVNSASIRAVGDTTACSITTDIKATSSVGNLACYFEWMPNSYGLTGNGFDIAGIPNQVGNLKLPWSISYFSGAERTKILISSGEYDFKTIAPIAPIITGVSSSISGAVLEGFSLNSYIRNEVITDLSVHVEPRNYTQFVSIGGTSSCSVPIGSSMCKITVGSVKFSDSDSDFGNRQIPLTINSVNNYFQSPTVEYLNLSWDYRPPVIETTVWNFTEDAKSIRINGQDIFTGGKTIAVSVKAPQSPAQGQWWHPAGLSLTVTPDGKFNPLSKVTLDDGTVIDFGKTWVTPTKRTLQPVSGPQQYGDDFLYIFDISDLSSGSYSGDFTVENRSGNKSTYNDGESKLMLSDDPSVLVLKNGLSMVKRDKVYFLNELIVVAYQGQEGLADVKSVVIDNVSVDLIPTNVKGIYYLKSGDNLTTNSEHTLSVIAENTYGKTSRLDLPFRYMPVKFLMKGIEDASILYSKVREYTSMPVQKEGDSCNLYTSEESAKEFLAWTNASSGVIACYVQWNNVPEGLEFYLKGKQPGLTGYFNKSGENILDYTVFMLNGRGSKAIAAHNRSVLKVVIPYNPIISFKLNKATAELNDNTALSFIEGGEAARGVFKVVPADIDVSLKPEGSDATVTHFKNRAVNSDFTSFTQRVKVPASPLWTKHAIAVEASYSKDPTLISKSNLTVYSVPNSNIRAYLKIDDKNTATGLTFPVKFNIGRYSNDCRCTRFNIKDMGEWDVVIYAEKRTSVKDPVTGRYTTIVDRTAMTKSLPVNAEGAVESTISMDNVDLGNHRIVAVATVRSPFTDFKMVRESSSVSIRVYKGEELEGGLSKSLIMGRIPLSTMVSFRTKTTSDADALSPTEWQISSDNGSSWQVLEDMTGHKSVHIKKNEVGKWLYRAKLVNKYSKKVSYTDVLTVITYQKPKPSLNIDRVLEGNDIPVHILDNDVPLPNGVAEILWSEDGENWTSGDTTYVIKGSLNPPRYIYSKFRYLDSDDLVQETSWGEVSSRVSYIKAKRLTVSYEGDSRIEVGKKVTLKGIYSNPNQEYDPTAKVSEEWVLPNGSIIQGGALDVVLTEDMLSKSGYASFEYHAWLTNNKDNTVGKRSVSVKSWVYSFPEAKLSTKLRYPMIPSSLSATLSVKDVDYPGVTFTRQWIYDHSAMQIEKDEGDKKTFTIMKAGTHTLTVLYHDNRNNITRLENTFTVDEQSAMGLIMAPKFSNKFMRQPLDVSLRSTVKLAHSADEIDSVIYNLNGKVIDGGKNYWSQYFSGLKEGKYKLGMDVVSKFGQRGTASLDFDVVANIPPVCELNHTSTGLSWNFVMKCNDEDGKVVSYEWFVNGEERNVFGPTATLSKNLNKGEQVIKVIAYDDSGDSDTQTVTVFGPSDN